MVLKDVNLYLSGPTASNRQKPFDGALCVFWRQLENAEMNVAIMREIEKASASIGYNNSLAKSDFLFQAYDLPLIVRAHSHPLSTVPMRSAMEPR